MKPSKLHRSTTKRRKNAKGLWHASGWIRKKDKPKFDKMVTEAENVVMEVEASERPVR